MEGEIGRGGGGSRIPVIPRCRSFEEWVFRGGRGKEKARLSGLLLGVNWSWLFCFWRGGQEQSLPRPAAYQVPY